jgi:hypothetical protein
VTPALSGILAHGIGGRVDLPVPRWLFVYGAATVVVVSFVALAALWPEPRLEGRRPGRPLPEGVQRLVTSRVAERIVRGLSLAFFLLILAAAQLGDPIGDLNPAPWIIYIWFWVGLAFLHALFGNLWATLSPFDTIGRFLGLEEGRREYPRWLGRWPAAVLLLGFVWMELVYPQGSDPRILGIAILVYTAITIAGMWTFGRDTWNRNGESFAVYFELLGRLAPLGRDEEGRVIARPPLAGLTGVEPRPGLVAFLMVLIGSTSFDGFSRTSVWLEWLGGNLGGLRTFFATLGLVGMVLAVSGIYAVAMSAGAALSGQRWHPLAVRFAHSLVPIALAYAVAHYASLLVLEGQIGLSNISDPFAVGWNLIGTASWIPNFQLISPTAIWYVQVAAIVTGHVGGVVLAHDRAMASFPTRRALRTQYALLAVMVAFTAGGLLILSGG